MSELEQSSTQERADITSALAAFSENFHALNQSVEALRQEAEALRQEAKAERADLFDRISVRLRDLKAQIDSRFDAAWTEHDMLVKLVDELRPLVAAINERTVPEMSAERRRALATMVDDLAGRVEALERVRDG